MNHLVNFAEIDWTVSAVGARFKAFIHNNQRIRLIEFSGGFVEPDWCIHGHAGYVLDGSFSIDYNGKIEHYKKGDVIFIQRGENNKHKVIMEAGGWIQLLLYEII